MGFYYGYCTAVAKAYYYWPQIDLLMLSGFLYQWYEVEVIDAIVARMSFKKCFKKIMAGNFDVLIFQTCSGIWKEDFDFETHLHPTERSRAYI